MEHTIKSVYFSNETPGGRQQCLQNRSRISEHACTHGRDHSSLACGPSESAVWRHVNKHAGSTGASMSRRLQIKHKHVLAPHPVLVLNFVLEQLFAHQLELASLYCKPRFQQPKNVQRR